VNENPIAAQAITLIVKVPNANLVPQRLAIVEPSQ
jgi:hypothetical protein